MKSKKYTIFSLIVVVFGLFALTACGGKSIQSDLKSHDWNFYVEKEKASQDAHFTEDKLTLSKDGEKAVFDYKLNGKKISLDIGNGSRNFKIKKEKDTYKLSPIDEEAKEDTGNVTLIPK